MRRCLLVALLILVLPLQVGRAEYIVAEKIAAVVEDEIITATELAEQFQLYLLELQIPMDETARVDSLQDYVLDEFIDGILIVKEAERKEIEVTEDEIDLFVEQHLTQQMERFGGEAGFLAQLEREGVLRGYRAQVDPRALGVGIQALISVRLRQHTTDDVERFRSYVLAIPEVMRLYHMAGEDDFLIHVGVSDSEALRDLAMNSLTTRAEVAHIETGLIFECVEGGGETS